MGDLWSKGSLDDRNKTVDDNNVWTKKNLDKLLKTLSNYCPKEELKVKNSKILLIGPSQAGKSSFVNTIMSAFRKKMTFSASSGAEVKSLSQAYTEYAIFTETDKRCKFRICDSQGLGLLKMSDYNFELLLNGSVPDGYTFETNVPINSDEAGFKETTTLTEKIHCVCFVFAASQFSDMSPEDLGQFNTLKKKIYKLRIPIIVLLTNIDNVNPSLSSNVSAVFKSTRIYTKVAEISNVFGININQIHLVKNYKTESRPVQNIDILALTALSAMLSISEDYLYTKLSKTD